MELVTIVLILLGLTTWGAGIIGDTRHPGKKEWERTTIIGFSLLLCGVIGLFVSYARFVGGKG